MPNGGKVSDHEHALPLPWAVPGQETTTEWQNEKTAMAMMAASHPADSAQVPLISFIFTSDQQCISVSTGLLE